MKGYEIVRVTKYNDPIGYDNVSHKPICPERHQLVKEGNSKKELDDWWKKNKKGLDKGKYELLERHKDHKKMKWTKIL